MRKPFGVDRWVTMAVAGAVVFSVMGLGLAQAPVSDAEKKQALVDETAARLQKAPNSPDANFDYARTLELAGKAEEAEKAWNKFLEIESATPRAELVRRGWAPLSRQAIASGSQAYPRPSPDGGRLLYGWNSLYVVNLKEGNAPRGLAVNDLIKPCASDWSEDGGSLAVHGQDATGQAASVILEWTPGGPLREVLRTPGTYPKFSPTGPHVLVSNVPIWSTVVLDLRSGGRACVAWSRAEERGARNHAAWLPDGKRIVFHAWGANPADRALFTSECVPVDLPREPMGMLRSQQAPVKVTSNAANNELPIANPEGTAVVFNVAAPTGKTIWISDLEGKAAVSLGDGNTPSWSPDGRSLYYGFQGVVHEMKLGGLDPRPISIDLEDPGGQAGQPVSVLKLRVKNRTDKPQKASVEYRIYGPDSVQQTFGLGAEEPVSLAAAQITDVSCQVKDPTTLAGKTVKITCVLEDGQRVIKLVGFPSGK